MKKIKIGHIGTKHDHSTGKLDCVRKFPNIFEVVGIVEDDPVQLDSIKNHPSYRDYRFMTEEQLFNSCCDAIMVEGFELDLPHVAKRCAENGIHIHMDKPAGDDLSVFIDTLRIAKSKNLAVQLAYMYRYNPALLDCLSLIKAGKLGEIHSVTAVMNTAHSTDKRHWLGNFKGGNMFFLGCHMVDLVYLLQGVPDNVTPYLKSSGFGGTTSFDQTTAIFEYKKGTSIVQANSNEINGYGRRQLVVCGSEGTYEIHPLECPIGTMYTDISFYQPYRDKHIDRNIPSFTGSERYDTLMLDFAAIVRGEKENPFNYDYELQLQKLVLAASGYDINYKEETVL